jgi:OFA family oxalate/formate antiporter-like MFS transporter
MSAVIMQMCLGATYSWSVYVSAIRDLTGVSQGLVQLPFSLFYFVFPAAAMLSGIVLVPRFGPRRCAVTGGILFGSGWLLASLGDVNFAATVAGIGVVAGLGAGMGYIVPITVCIKWFPKNKGLVTGVAVAGFGGGAALVSCIGAILQSHMLTPFETFGVLGLGFFILVVLAGLSMQNPPGGEEKGRGAVRLRDAFTSKPFAVLYFAMTTGLAAGLGINANLKELFAEAGMRGGVTAVSLFAIANALGRIVWGAAADRIGARLAIQCNLLFQAAALIASLYVITSFSSFMVIAAVLGFNYGGVLVLYAAAIAGVWGQDRVSQVYGLMFSANVPAAFAPILAGLAYDHFGDFNVPHCVLAILMIGAALTVWRCSAVLCTENDGYPA